MDLIDNSDIDTAVVVPTLGQRPDYLLASLSSIRLAGESLICIVAPQNAGLSEVEKAGLIDIRVDDPNSGLPAAINHAIDSLPLSVKFITWLGDDDLLEPSSLTNTSFFLRNNETASAVFGGCHYIDSTGGRILTNASGKWAVPLISFGPDLIPQPGSLIRRTAFQAFGGLRTDLGWAFDVDLFINLKKQGKVRHLKEPLASFRWHPESLSVGQRADSVREASQVRISYLPRPIRRLSWIWEPAV
ncbi:MAG: hypothetical protein NT032_07525, partial [Actinobacteria bacterium]|nr:hypothetical protein [Actinomycetota bacterium]